MYDSNPNDAPDFDLLVSQESLTLIKVVPQHDAAEDWCEEYLPQRWGSAWYIPASTFPQLQALCEEHDMYAGVV